jgi:tripartite-type tricarboxylate transporter receptor subunit TctC
MMASRWAALALALLAPLILGYPVRAADYPTGPVRVVVPYPAGGLVDIVMRVVG